MEISMELHEDIESLDEEELRALVRNLETSPQKITGGEEFYQQVIRFAEDVIIDQGRRTDPADYYDYMEAPTSPRWEAEYNDLHITLQHGNLGKHESKPYGREHKSQKYGRKTVRIRPSEQILGGIELTYRQATDGDVKLIDAEDPGDGLLMMELQEYAEEYV